MIYYALHVEVRVHTKHASELRAGNEVIVDANDEYLRMGTYIGNYQCNPMNNPQFRDSRSRKLLSGCFRLGKVLTTPKKCKRRYDV